MASRSFGSQKALAGKVMRSGVESDRDADLRSDIEAGFTAVEAEIDGLGGGGGAAIEVVTVTSAEIAASGSENISTLIDSSDIVILGVQLTRTAGASTSVTVTLYSDDGFGTAMDVMFGADGFAQTIGADPVYGPHYEFGGNTTRAARFYHDDDLSSELHVKIDNNDGVEVGTFEMVVNYMSLAF